jgi:hypothetical protein
MRSLPLIPRGADRRPRPLEVIEREITRLASDINAATCRWLDLVAEYDARDGWAHWGARSCADWVSLNCAISPHAAREHVRVARRLQELPLVRAAFAAGRLSYSKARAVTRIEDIDREHEIVELAATATAAQLERLVRGYRRVVAVERIAQGGPPERWADWGYDDDGSLLLRARLPAEEGALVVAALERARDLRDVSAETPVADGEPPAAALEAAPTAGEPHAVALEAPPTAGERRADALLLVTESFMAAEPRTRTGGDRCQVVVHVDVATLTGDGAAGPPAEGVSAETRCELDGGPPLAAVTARRLACDASIVRIIERDGRPLSVGRRTRSIPTALRRALDARDGGCQFPGCGSRRHVDAHHIEHWARGGETRLGNLVQLCRRHHRLLHEEGYAVERDDGRLVFRRPDGRRIAAHPAPPRGHATRVRSAGACVPPQSTFERLDLARGVDAMLAFAPVASSEARGAPYASARAGWGAKKGVDT